MLGKLSLERKLPLLITGLLAVVIAAAIALTYREVRESAELVAVDRLDRVSRQLSELVSASTEQRSRLLRQAANDSAIQRAVMNGVTNGDARVSEALDRLIIPTDSGLPIQLWTTEGRRVSMVGRFVDSTNIGTTQPPLVSEKRIDAPPARLPSEAVHFGPFYVSHDKVYYWIAAPVIVNGERRGWITEQGRIAPRPETTRRVNALIGGGSSAYFRNSLDSVWVTIGGSPVAAPNGPPLKVPLASGPSARDTTSYVRNGREMLGAQAPITGTPWAVVVEVPRQSIVASARSLLQRFGLVGVLLLIGGALSALALSRSITRPLSALTDAAASVARGNYAARVPAEGNDEVSRLADSFNRMASDVATAHAELQGRVVQVQALADERDAALATAISASNAKSSFLATMSHEIRTPINAILGYADILEVEIAGPLTKEQRGYLARVKASTEHLLGLVNEVLDLARVESGTMQVDSTAVDTTKAIHAAASLIEPQASAKGISISVQPGGRDAAMFVGDERRAHQALANLLSNAVKFSPQGGHITVAYSRQKFLTREVAGLSDAQLKNNQEYVAISVADQGIGISRNDTSRIFQPFTQLETTTGNTYTRSASGAGLGLSISRQLARLMCGDITVDSQPAEGSTFTLWLPAFDVGISIAQQGTPLHDLL